MIYFSQNELSCRLCFSPLSIAGFTQPSKDHEPVEIYPELLRINQPVSVYTVIQKRYTVAIGIRQYFNVKT